MSENSALGGLLRRFLKGVNITGDTVFSGKVVVDSSPTEDDTLILSMSTTSEFTDVSTYARPITGTYTVGTDDTVVNSEYAIMTTTTSFIESDLGISGESDFSVSFWFYSSVSNIERVLSIGRAGTILSGEGFFDIYLNNSILVFTISSFTTPPTSATGGTIMTGITIGQWNHIVFTYQKDIRLMNTYINGNYKSSIARDNVTWSIPTEKGILRAGAESERPTTAGWWIGRINVAWGRAWDNDDITGLLANDWKPKLSLKNSVSLRVSRLAELVSTKALPLNPIFSGTVKLPSTTAVLYNNTSLSSLLITAGNKVPTISFGIASLIDAYTIKIPFSSPVSLPYIASIVVNEIDGIAMTVVIKEYNTNFVSFRIMRPVFDYILIRSFKDSLNINCAIIKEAKILNCDNVELKTSVSATGGTITEVNGYRIHTFTTSGTFTVDVGGEVEYLIVAGGGGGGMNAGAGGGAGGFITGSHNTTTNSYSIVIGSGGAGGTTSAVGTWASNGANSTALGLTAIGGGAGVNSGGANGRAGGSGGGAANDGTGNRVGGAGTTGQGFKGGDGTVPGGGERTGGGGGGAGGAGQNSVSPTQAGAGGIGLQSSISGSNIYYAGGGGGGVHSGTGGAGGLGGGGGENVAGAANTGGGGGAARHGSGSGRNGGSGIVIIRYLL